MRAMSDLRMKVAALAKEYPEFRSILVPLLKKTAMEFTRKEWEAYHKEHPGAKATDHKIVDDGKSTSHTDLAKIRKTFLKAVKDRTDDDGYLDTKSLHKDMQEVAKKLTDPDEINAWVKDVHFHADYPDIAKIFENRKKALR